MFVICMCRNRNSYASLLLSMLKRGCLEGPFVDKPHQGPLASLLSPHTVCSTIRLLLGNNEIITYTNY